MSKKILLVRATPNDLDINGYNVQQIGLGKVFVKLGYDYDFITFKHDGKHCKETVFYEENGHTAKVIEKPRFRFFRWGINLDVSKKDFLDQYDLIICQEYYQLQTFLCSRASNKVVLYNGPYYNLFMPKWFSPIYDKFFGPRLNKQIKYKFVKSVLSEQFLAAKGYNGLYNIGVGLDTTRFDNVHEIKPENQELVDFMKKNRCILYVGALSARKNYPFLLETYQKVLEYAPDVKFVMIGKSVVSATAKLMGIKDEAYAAKYYNKLPQKVKDGIYHVKRIENSQLKFIYPLAKAFLLPSKLEIFGMVLLEAMYLGTPVITSRNGGSMTLIDGKETGQIVPEFDAEKWTSAVMKYIDNPNYTEKVKTNAIRLVRDEYNWFVLANKFLTISKTL
jgi:glycosyltransferase involved in cell wall biosynthesis